MELGLTVLIAALSSILTALIYLLKEYIGNSRGVENSFKKSLLQKLSGLISPSNHPSEELKVALLDVFVQPRLLPLYQEKAEGSSVFIEEVMNSNKRIILLGSPGSGKTTLLQYLAVKAASGRKFIPIFIQLRDISQTQNEIVNIEKYINNEYISQFSLKSTTSSSFFAKALEQGDCLILMDGLDEVPNLDAVTSGILNFVNEFPKNLFIISSRTASFRSPLPTFSIYSLEDFGDEEIQSFIRNRVLALQLKIQSDTPVARKRAEEESTRLTSIICTHNYLHQMARNPLLLTMMVKNYLHYGDLPDKRAKLLEYFVQSMLEGWDWSKGISSDFTFTERRKLLGILALKMQTKQIWCMSQNELRKILLEPGDKKEYSIEEINRILEEVIIRSGLLVEEPRGVIRFSHRILQEYLAASELASHQEGEEKLLSYLNDDTWVDTCVLYASLINDATRLMQELLKPNKPNSSKNLLIAGRCIASGARVDTSLRNEVLERLKEQVDKKTSFHEQAASILDVIDKEIL